MFQIPTETKELESTITQDKIRCVCLSVAHKINITNKLTLEQDGNKSFNIIDVLFRSFQLRYITGDVLFRSFQTMVYHWQCIVLIILAMIYH